MSRRRLWGITTAALCCAVAAAAILWLSAGLKWQGYSQPNTSLGGALRAALKRRSRFPVAEAPTSCKQVFEIMPSRFNKEAAKGLNAVYQFDLSGDGGGKWYVIVANESCQVKEGSHASPNITISMTAQDYLAMVSGKLNGQVAFMSGKLRIAGDMGLALRMQSIFPQ